MAQKVGETASCSLWACKPLSCISRTEERRGEETRARAVRGPFSSVIPLRFLRARNAENAMHHSVMQKRHASEGVPPGQRSAERHVLRAR